METGTKWYAEEIVHGRLFKIHGRIREVNPMKKVVLAYSFPISIVSGGDWLESATSSDNSIGPGGSATVTVKTKNIQSIKPFVIAR